MYIYIYIYSSPATSGLQYFSTRKS